MKTNMPAKAAKYKMSQIKVNILSFTEYAPLSIPHTKTRAMYSTSYTTPLSTPHNIQQRNMKICIYLKSFCFKPVDFALYLTPVMLPLAEN